MKERIINEREKRSRQKGAQVCPRPLKRRADEIGAILDTLFPVPDAELRASDSFTFLVAVMLSAQCTDKRVNLITPQLFALASTPQKMIELGFEKIMSAIASCGLSRNKARFIMGMSQMLLERFGGAVPQTLEELEQLPGVGHKTASVVIWKCFSIPAFPVDTHIFRCARRWGLSKGESVVHVERDLKTCFDRHLWGKVHLQIILFARKYCPARGHDAANCPICSHLAIMQKK